MSFIPVNQGENQQESVHSTKKFFKKPEQKDVGDKCGKM
jgi:hypothetical protein